MSPTRDSKAAGLEEGERPSLLSGNQERRERELFQSEDGQNFAFEKFSYCRFEKF